MPGRILIAIMLLFASPALAQDIVGVEDCARAQGPDKKIGCLQSNVLFLHDLIKKNEAAAQARQRDVTAKLTAATARIDELKSELDRLKAAVAALEKKNSAK